MPPNVFSAFFDKLSLPVFVARKNDPLPVVYLNQAAKLYFLPTSWGGQARWIGNDDLHEPLDQILRFQDPDRFTVFKCSLTDSGVVGELSVTLLSFQGELMRVRIVANAMTLDNEGYYVIYLIKGEERRDSKNRIVDQMLHASYHLADVNQAVQSILQLAGDHVGASHAFIFEEVAPGVTRNTYEWVAPGAEPLIDKLQNLTPDDYAYNLIMASDGMVVTDDTRTIPKHSKMCELGLKSVAILPLYHYDEPLGFMGFDDCEKPRTWSTGDIQLLKNTAGIVASLLNRRNAEQQSRRSQEIFRTIADNLEELVYITDLETYELKFISKSLARSLGRSSEDVLGLPCWLVLHSGQEGPCPFCPLPSLLAREKGDTSSCIWELHNSTTGKWYMVKNNIIDWIDGKPVHLGTLVDISYRKQYEEQLKRFAATDAMTDAFNRKWGYGKLSELFAAPEETRRGQTLCFLDMDGLKRVNDTLGHAVGDEMIMNTIQTVLSCIRKDDFIIRWGGDEFVVFLNCSLDNAEKVLGKIMFAFEHFNSTGGKAYRLSVSAGLVSFGEPAASLDELVDEADRRMYMNKIAKRSYSGVLLR